MAARDLLDAGRDEVGGNRLRGLLRPLRWLAAVIDDALPMPGDQRAERDWVPLSGEEVARRRRRRLRIHLFEKRGKGGFR